MTLVLSFFFELVGAEDGIFGTEVGYEADAAVGDF
jgi:hypothetical protein